MMDVQSMEEIYKSWDHIKSLPNYQEEFGVSLFAGIHALSKRVGALFYDDEKNKADRIHAKLFTQMMDFIVHMWTGPDMEEEVFGQLEDLGERHAEKYGVTSKMYLIFGEALISTLELLLGTSKFTSFTRQSWLSLWRIMSMTMLQGARRVKRRQRRKEKQQQQRLLLEQYKLLQAEVDDEQTDMTESSSSLTSLSTTDLIRAPTRTRRKHEHRKTSRSCSPDKMSPRRGHRKKNHHMMTMMLMDKDGNGSSTSYLSYSDEEDLFSPRPPRRGRNKSNLLINEESTDAELEVFEEDEEQPLKPSSFSGQKTKGRRNRTGLLRKAESCRSMFASKGSRSKSNKNLFHGSGDEASTTDEESFQFDEEEEPLKKPSVSSSFSMGSKNKRRPGLMMMRPESCRSIFSSSTTITATMGTSAEQQHRKGRGGGGMLKMSSFRFRKDSGKRLGE